MRKSKEDKQYDDLEKLMKPSSFKVKKTWREFNLNYPQDDKFTK